MIKNYFKTALRSLLNNKVFSLINIAGLAIGTICCLYIIAYVTDQYSYDRHHRQVADIYRVNSLLGITSGESEKASCSPPIGPAMKLELPEVLEYTRVVPTERLGAKQHLLHYQDKSLYEKAAVYADSTFFNVFTYHFVYGDNRHALDAPYTVVLKKSLSDKLFGETNPVGKVIEIDNAYGRHGFKVTGVVDDRLGKSHIQSAIFMAMNSGGMGSVTYNSTSWAAYNYVATYVKLHHGAAAAALERKLPAFLQLHGAAQLKEMGMKKELHLQPVTSIHTTGGYDNELSKTVSSTFLKMLLLIAVLIQVIACINFMNLTTARASRRAKEVGVRKIIGAGMNDLVKQFLGESLLLSLVAMLLALPVLALVRPFLNAVTRADISMSFMADYRFVLLLLGITIITGLLAGSYPAFYLSAFKPINTIKGQLNNHISAAGIRRLLVVFQFVLSIVFISAIVVIYFQLSYIRHKDLGFEKQQRLVFNFYTDDSKGRIPAFMNDLQQLSEVKSATMADNYPGQVISKDWPYYLEGKDPASSNDVAFIFSDENFAKTMGIRLLSGRDFRAGDSGRALVNEAFCKVLGLDPLTAVGKRLYPKDYQGEPGNFLEIAGVLKDFNYTSLHTEVKPFMLRYQPEYGKDIVVVSTSSVDYSGLLDKVAAIWQRDFPTVPFTYSFLDEDVQRQYETETTLSGIINLFTFIAIFLSCLGLFGLSVFDTEQRRKEIGIRKVLGASMSGLVMLLSKDFLKLIGISFVIALPFAWWIMSRWLDAFPYRVSLSWWMFALAGAGALLIAFGTISFQAIKGALANPINNIKAE
ncbi:ABC transporter permease [Chitinophaga parva]|uniref:ABC transporter permease n=1 Tax=Chitinophaga parva TaxID=2169414 RepID=A0A2T7BQ87_9BACT|nr:ABC transporter permease [Chitinophaga parva]PUZ29848.1 ABC transporter permease [Chitinophaga parva]